MPQKELFCVTLQRHSIANNDIPNVELIRAKDGAPAAPQLASLTKASDPSIGSTCSFVLSD
jgi:hypothetical protein